jgi:hypothetical protein
VHLITIKIKATGAIKVYQKKGQDFSEEVNSHYVNASIRANNFAPIVEDFLKYKHRIGAWTTPSSFHK